MNNIEEMNSEQISCVNGGGWGLVVRVVLWVLSADLTADTPEGAKTGTKEGEAK